LFPDYKRKEPPTPDKRQFLNELYQQEAKVREILSMLGVRQYESDGGEADDVIGTLATCISNRGLNCAIFSGDSDLQQLVDERTRCLAPAPKNREVVWDIDAVYKRWGIYPKDIPLLKALAGDGSDGIPGIPSVGPVTAAKMILAHGPDLEHIIDAATDPEYWSLSERFRGLIIEHRAQLPMYLKLTTIQRDMKLVAHPVNRDPMGARRVMSELKFRRLLEAGKFHDLKSLAQ
jgi:DNA polymerase-1